jgi:hypothetical protein
VLLDAGADPNRDPLYRTAKKPIDHARRVRAQAVIDLLEGPTVKVRSDKKVKAALDAGGPKKVSKGRNA